MRATMSAAGEGEREPDEEITVHSYTETHEDSSTEEVEYAFPSSPDCLEVFNEIF